MKSQIIKCFTIVIFFLQLHHTLRACNPEIFGPATLCQSPGSTYIYDVIDGCQNGTWVINGGTFLIQQLSHAEVTWSLGTGQYIAYVIPGVWSDTIYMQDCCSQITGMDAIVTDQNLSINNGTQFQSLFSGGSVAISLGSPNIITVKTATFAINGILLIPVGWELNLQGCSVYMGPGAHIKLQRNAANTIIKIDQDNFGTPTIIQSSTNCNKMWRGISAGEGNQIYVQNNSTLQDAQFGISVLDKCLLYLKNSNFIHNYVSVCFPEFPPAPFNHFTSGSLIEGNYFGYPGLLAGHFNGQFPEPQNNQTITAILAHKMRGNVGSYNGLVLSSDGSTINGTNIFEGLNCGVAGINSTMTIFNCTFSSMIYEPAYSNYAFSGFSISSENYTGNTPLPVLTVGNTGGNLCNILGPNGINTIGSVESHIIKNTISTPNGGTGIRISFNKITGIEIVSNTLTNPALGISIFELSPQFQYVNISDNIINGTPSQPSPTLEGIGIFNTFPYKIPTSINRNVISDCVTAIRIFNLYNGGYFDINNNQIDLNIDPANFIASTYTGIHLANTAIATAQENQITWQFAVADPTIYATNLNGFLIEECKSSNIYKNTINQFGTGLYWRNNCDYSFMHCNTINDCYPGVYFDNVIIPDQGSSCYANFNTFNPIVGSYSVLNQKLDGFTQSGTKIKWYYPGSAVTSNPYYPKPSPSLLILPQVVSTACIPLHPCGEHNPDLVIIHDDYQNLKLEQIADGNITYTVLPFENQYIADEMAYKIMDDNPGLINSVDKQSFVQAEELSNKGILKNIEDAINTDDFITAQALNNSIATTEVIESNKKTIIEIYLNTVAVGNYWLTQSQHDLIENIGLQTAAIGGEGVYWARGMLHMPVAESGYSEMRLLSNKVNDLSHPEITEIAKGIFEISSENIISEVLLYDLQGKIIFAKKGNGSDLIIINHDLINGVYLFRIQLENGSSSSRKVFVRK
ncbi:MAG: T9SS type A sorting domain-containing protein [Bacteroidota bacterium]